MKNEVSGWNQLTVSRLWREDLYRKKPDVLMVNRVESRIALESDSGGGKILYVI